MIAALWAWAASWGAKLIGGLLSSPIGTGAVVLALCAAWNFAIDNPRVRREATATLVSRVELDAEKAKAAELARQVAAGEAALARLQKLMTDWDTAQEAEDAQREKDIAALEAQLAATGRSRPLDCDDIKFLQRHDKTQPGC